MAKTYHVLLPSEPNPLVYRTTPKVRFWPRPNGNLTIFKDQWDDDVNEEPPVTMENEFAMTVLVQKAEGPDGEAYAAERGDVTMRGATDEVRRGLRREREEEEEGRHDDQGRDGGDDDGSDKEGRRVRSRRDPPTAPIGHWRRRPLEIDREFGFNERPDGCSEPVWSMIKKMHLNLAHLSPAGMTRVFRKMGANADVLHYARCLRCSVCEETVRPAIARTARVPRATVMNEVVSLDEMEVALSDDARVLLLLVTDEATRLTVILLTKSVRSISGHELVELFTAHWCTPYGPPDTLQFDAAAAHLGAASQEKCRTLDITVRTVPAEAHHQQGRAESRINFFKDLFAKVCAEVSLTVDDNPWTWTAKIGAAMNSYVRSNGFSAYQHVFGREPKVPTSIVNNSGGQGAHRTVFDNPVELRAEEIRAAAGRATIEYDTNAAI